MLFNSGGGGGIPMVNYEQGRGTHSPAGQALQGVAEVGVPGKEGNRPPQNSKMDETCGYSPVHLVSQGYP